MLEAEKTIKCQLCNQEVDFIPFNCGVKVVNEKPLWLCRACFYKIDDEENSSASKFND
jgi:hypothetical protein